MMEEHMEVVEKLRNILDSFLKENFSVTNNVYFEKLISHLASKEYEPNLQDPFALKWLDRCVTIITEDFNNLNPKVISFMFNFCSLLMKNEWIIVKIKEHNIMDRIMAIIDRDVHQFNPSMKLGCIRLLSSITHYSIGVAFIRYKKAWRFLVDCCNKDHTLYVVREARQLLYELLYKFCVKTKDDSICLEILTEIVKPLKENVYEDRTDKMMINVDDSELQHKLVPTLDLLAFIFQKTLVSEKKTNIVYLCEEHFNLEITIWKYCDMTQNSYFFEKILSTLSSFNFAKLVFKQWTSGQIPAENFNEFGVFFLNTMKFCVSRHEWVCFLKMAELNHVLWKKLGERAPKEIQIENERVQFENQLITVHLMPVLFILKSKEHMNEELFDNYIMKLFEISCEHTLRLCYAYRDEIFSSEAIVTQLSADLAYKSIHSILSMENILNREQAVLVIQAMIYALKEFTIDSGENRTFSNAKKVKRTDPIVEIPNVLYACLVGLQTLIHRYKITWKESIETICVVNFVTKLLENPNMSTRLAVQALKSAQLSIEHFLSPNMALLMDNLQGSGLQRLGPIIVKRFHDTAWEVRDSALELATSIACISCIKFPAFQQFILDHNICPIAYEMAKNDCEPYVRASAFKCISKMIPINIIWESCLKQLNLIEHLFYVIYNESEAIVRKEAVCVLIKIYDHRKVPNNFKSVMYSSLCYCVAGDLHWEVKVMALHFWELEIQKQFTNQGMIDGTFPTVTFSRENKKIVTLNEKEIMLRIRKVFHELSQLGCLGVIIKCLYDECDFEVTKTAVCLVKRLLETLNKYDCDLIVKGLETNNINDKIPTLTGTDLKESSVFIIESSETDLLNSDDVIEGILSAQDINLLISAYEKQLNLSADDEKNNGINSDYYKEYAKVDAKEFIETIKSMNLDALLENHNKWFLCAESFSSLLDDILCEISPEEIITADCY